MTFISFTDKLSTDHTFSFKQQWGKCQKKKEYQKKKTVFDSYLRNISTISTRHTFVSVFIISVFVRISEFFKKQFSLIMTFND